MKDPKFIYKAERPYTEDINDLIEKGGKGSGVKGHSTPQESFETKHPYASGYKVQSHGHSKEEAMKLVQEHNEKHGAASAAIFHQDGPRSGPKSQYFLTHDDVKKGGPGSGIKGHTTAHQVETRTKELSALSLKDLQAEYRKFKPLPSKDREELIKEILQHESKSGSSDKNKAPASTPSAASKESNKPKIPKYPSCVVFDSKEGMIKVAQRDGYYYADVDNKFDMSADTLEEMEKKLAKLGAKYAGQDRFG